MVRGLQFLLLFLFLFVDATKDNNNEGGSLVIGSVVIAAVATTGKGCSFMGMTGAVAMIELTNSLLPYTTCFWYCTNQFGELAVH